MQFMISRGSARGFSGRMHDIVDNTRKCLLTSIARGFEPLLRLEVVTTPNLELADD